MQEVHQLMLFVPSAIRYHQALVLAARNVRPFHSSHKAIGVEISNIVSIHVVVTNELNCKVSQNIATNVILPSILLQRCRQRLPY